MVLKAQVNPSQCPSENTNDCYLLFDNNVRQEFIQKFMELAYPGLEYEVTSEVFKANESSETEETATV